MNNLIKLGKEKNIDIEIYKEKNNITNINTLNDKVKLFQITNVTNYIIKAIKNNRCIKLATDKINNSKKIINTIEEIFETSDNKNNNELCCGSIKTTSKPKTSINYEEIKKDLISLNELKSIYPCIKSIEAEYANVSTNKSINNKLNNCSMEDEYFYNYYGASITLENMNKTKVVYVSYYKKEYNFNDFKNYLINKLESSIKKLTSTSIKTNKYKVILTNNVVTSILDTFADSFQSKSIYLKESVLTDKLNKQIFSNKISIIEDSPNGIINSNFDIEGTIKKRQVLVDKGIFINDINNKEYAIKENKKPTGNADGVNNLYIEPGNKTFSELVKLLNDGIIIDEAVGFHSGVDKKTGNISVQAEGLLIKSGKIIKGLDMIILSTNFYEIFNNVIEVGNDLSKCDLNVSTPSLLLNDIIITGKE